MLSQQRCICCEGLEVATRGTVDLQHETNRLVARRRIILQKIEARPYEILAIMGHGKIILNLLVFVM
jgi:hypothetical protein